MAKGMNDINLPICFDYILLRVRVPPPKLGLKHWVRATTIRLP
jgi:hypothetical protein